MIVNVALALKDFVDGNFRYTVDPGNDACKRYKAHLGFMKKAAQGVVPSV